MNLRSIRTTYYLIDGLFWFSTALLSPLYVLFLLDRGMGLSEVGLWSGANIVAVIALEIPTGSLADSWGRGRTYALANLVISISLMLMVFLPGKTVLYIGAALFGSGRALASGSLDAWFVDALKNTASRTDTEKELGRAGGITLGALAAGSLIGALLPGFLTASAGVITPLAVPIIADAILKLAVVLGTMVLIRDPGDSIIPALRRSLRSVPDLIGSVGGLLSREPLIPFLFGAGILVSLVTGSLETFWQPRLAELIGRSSGLVFGVVIAGGFLSAALCSMLIPEISRILGGRRYLTAILFSVLTAFAVFLLACTRTPAALAAALATVYFLVEGVGLPRRAILNDLVPPEIRATVLSIDSFVSYLGFAGIIGLGYLAETSGVPVVWMLVSLVFLPTALLFLPFHRGM